MARYGRTGRPVSRLVIASPWSRSLAHPWGLSLVVEEPRAYRPRSRRDLYLLVLGLNQRHRGFGGLFHDVTQGFSLRPSLPGSGVASMNRMSPPVAVQARPKATPGTSTRSAISCVVGSENRDILWARDADGLTAFDEHTGGLAMQHATRTKLVGRLGR